MKTKIIVLLVISVVLLVGAVADSSINWLSVGQANSLYCKQSDGCGGGSSSSDFEVYFNMSIKTDVEFFINESDASTVDTYSVSGDKFIFGGLFI